MKWNVFFSTFAKCLSGVAAVLVVATLCYLASSWFGTDVAGIVVMGVALSAFIAVLHAKHGS